MLSYPFSKLKDFKSCGFFYLVFRELQVKDHFYPKCFQANPRDEAAAKNAVEFESFHFLSEAEDIGGRKRVGQLEHQIGEVGERSKRFESARGKSPGHITLQTGSVGPSAQRWGTFYYQIIL